MEKTDSLRLDSLMRMFEIEEVQVTARALEKDVIQPQTLGGLELSRMNALSVADAIRFFSGVQLKDYGGVGGIKTINIRSMGSQHVGIYYNGVELGNAQNGQVDLGKFSLDNMEEIQLYHGQKSDIFQSAREFGSAGSVYLNTRRPRFKEGEKVHARLQMRAGSFALANPSAQVDVRLTETMSMTASAEYVHSDGKYKFRYRRVTPSGDVAYDTTAIRQNGDVEAVRAELALNHYYSNTGFWKTHFYAYNSERGVPGAIVNNVWRNGERLWDRNLFGQLTWQDLFLSRLHMKANLKYANDYTHYINEDTRLLYVDNEYLQQELYATVAAKVEVFDWWDVSMAYDMQWNHLSKYMDATRWSHWLSAAMAFNAKNCLRAQISLLGTFINDNQATHKARLTPAAFISVRPFQHPDCDLRFNAFYKHSYRFPTFNDLYYTDMGNANLRPELARMRSIGLSYDWRTRWHASIDYYYNRVTDKIVAYPKGQQFRWTMLNLGEVKINGLDVSLRGMQPLPMGFSIGGTLQYTYQTAIDVTNPTDTYYGHQIPYIPWHSGSATFNFAYHSRRGDDYGLSYSFIYSGERYGQQENIIYNYVQPWYTHDLSLYGAWLVRNHTLKLNIEINNLLGQDYEVIANYPMPKQNVRCTFSVTY